MSPASYVTSEMKTNIAQRKKKSPPSSFSFSRTGTFDASGSLFLPTQALDLCDLDQPHRTRTPGSRARRRVRDPELYRRGRARGLSGSAKNPSGPVRGPGEDRGPDRDPVEGEREEAVLPDPGHEGGDARVGDHEGDGEADPQHDPAVEVHGDRPRARRRLSDQGLEELVPGRGEHGREGQEERELQGRGAGEPGDLAGRDGGHRARGAREDGGQ